MNTLSLSISCILLCVHEYFSQVHENYTKSIETFKFSPIRSFSSFFYDNNAILREKRSKFPNVKSISISGRLQKQPFLIIRYFVGVNLSIFVVFEISSNRSRAKRFFTHYLKVKRNRKKIVHWKVGIFKTLKFPTTLNVRTFDQASSRREYIWILSSALWSTSPYWNFSELQKYSKWMYAEFILFQLQVLKIG